MHTGRDPRLSPPQRGPGPPRRTRWALATIVALAASACGSDDDTTWTQQPGWGTAPLDTSGGGVAPPPSPALPGSSQPAPAAPYDPRPQDPPAETPLGDGSYALALDRIEVTNTGWIGCEFVDWRMLAVLPSFGVGFLTGIPLLGAAVKETVAWGLRLFAVSDIACDLRVNVTLGNKSISTEAADGLVLFEGLSEADVSGRTLSVEVFDCELCDDGQADWTTSLGTCSTTVDSSDLKAGGLQLDCTSENVEWLNEQLRSLVGQQDAELFSPIAARLTFSLRR